MRKISVAKPGWVLAVAAVAVFALAAPAADPVDGKFQAFDNARLVVGGVPPDNMAADLTSDCTSAPAPCGFSPTDSGVAFIPNNNHFPTVADLTNLSTDYNFGAADCGGGSPRFVILLAGGDNLTGDFGQPPNFTNCFYGWQNTGNFTTDPTTRWQFNLNNINISWATVQATYGTRVVTQIFIVLDAGWTTPRGQDVTIDNFTVNSKVMHAEDAFHH